MYVYANMKQDEDTRVAEFQELSARSRGLNAEVGQAASFVRPEILAIDQTVIEKFLADTPGLKMYAQYLDDILRRRPHTLSPKEEELLSMTRAVTQGPIQVFNMLDDADIRYGTMTDEDGKEVELTKQRYYAFLESPDRRVRRDAMNKYNEAYVEYENTLGANLASQMQCDWFYAKARHYKTSLAAALDNYNIPSVVYENLISAASNNLAPLHQYNELRKKVLGLDIMYKYDSYVPIVPAVDVEFPYDKAVEDVLAAVKPLGKDYVAVAREGITKGGWIDVYETEGKTSGGYNWGSFGTNPYILMNYSNKIDDVFTLAHELGHAMHHYYTVHNQPYIYGDPTLFTAEVASNVNEVLLMDYLLKKTKDPALKKYILNKQIDNFIGTFYTQCMFSQYEHALHQKVEAGEGLSAEGMREIYRDIYQRYWGPSLTLTELDDMTGLRVYHFYRDYYVYQYATGVVAAMAIADRILSKEKGAVDDYIQFLKSGSSKYPIDLLRDAGVDMTSPEPINRAVNRFEKLLVEFEKLLGA
jgi:oligoendopeptidase F